VLLSPVGLAGGIQHGDQVALVVEIGAAQHVSPVLREKKC